MVTTLSNDVMPLVRYRIGDYVERLSDESGDHFRLRYIPDGPGPASARLAKLQDELNGLLGPESGIALEQVAQVLAERSGKFRLTVPLVEATR